jgi:5-methylcytosine-specific restriction enzyme subunit McrC
MGKPITLFEHECTSGFDWTDRDLAFMERLRHSLGTEFLRPTVRAGRRELQATQHVGVIRFGSRSLQVLPKIYQSSEAADKRQRTREATGNLLHMLEMAGYFPVREHGLASLLNRDADWFEILTRLFASHLREEWQRGPAKSYHLVEEELPKLKGKWRITDQIRRPTRKHLFSVAYDEFTADNPLNRVFRFVVERLWRLTRDSGNRQSLGELRHWLDDVTLLPSITVDDARPGLLTRLTQRFTPLLNLARLFLDKGTLQLAAGSLDSFAFVLDMNKLFEAFLVGFIRRYRRSVLPASLAGCRLLPQTQGASLHLARNQDNARVFRLKPDLALRSGHTFPMLMDAKYKGLEPDVSGAGVAQGDFNQMFAYAHRYDCPRVLMLYPQTADMPSAFRQEFSLEGTTGKTVVVATVDIRLDLGSPQGRVEIVERLRQVFQGKGVQS